MTSSSSSMQTRSSSSNNKPPATYTASQLRSPLPAMSSYPIASAPSPSSMSTSKAASTATAATRPTSTAARLPPTVTTRAALKGRQDDDDSPGAARGEGELAAAWRKRAASGHNTPVASSSSSTSPPASQSPQYTPIATPPLSAASSTSASRSVSAPATPPRSESPPLSLSDISTRPHSRSSFGQAHNSAAATAMSRASTTLAASASSFSSSPAVQRLSASLSSLPFLSALSERLGASPLTVATVGCLCSALVSMGLLGVWSVLELLLFLYPAYLSYHALEAADQEDIDRAQGRAAATDGSGQQEVRRWLVYWCVYGLLTAAFRLSDWLLPGSRSSFLFCCLRLALLLALSHPQSQLPMLLYSYVVRPVFDRNVHRLQRAVDVIVHLLQQLTADCKLALFDGIRLLIRGGVDARGGGTESRAARLAAARQPRGL